jgi:macrolide transport system ATP-binding/permease protein
MKFPRWRQRKENELEAEIRSHLDEAIRERVERGETPEEARANALREFGNVGLVKEITRQMWGWASLDRLQQDLKFALRVFLKKPGVALVAVLTLGIGVGVNAALFTVFNAFVLKPLPIQDPASLVNLTGVDKQGEKHRLFSYLDYLDLRQQTRVFSDVVAWNKARVTLGDAPPNLGDGDAFAPGYEYLFGQIVSGNYFSALGAEMALGRPFSENEDVRPGEHPVVVLSHSFWKRRFKSDEQIIGRAIELHGFPFTVIGVTAPEFIGVTPDVPSFWAPLMMRDQFFQAGAWGHGRWRTDRSTDVVDLLGRLKDGFTREQAEADTKLLIGRLAQTYPRDGCKTGVRLESAGTLTTINEDLKPVVLGLSLCFGLVLLIACANVTNLLLARAAFRRREIAVRLALGASRWRVVRQLLTESLLLAFAGGAAGTLLADWTLRTLYPIALSSVPIPEGLSEQFSINLSLDWRVFGFTFLLASAAGVAAGLVPALQTSKPDLTSALKDDGPNLGRHFNHSRLRSGLVVLQIAVCLTLLIGAGLLLRNLRRVQTIDTGMTIKNVFAVGVGVSGIDRNNLIRIGELRKQLAERLRAAPGVVSLSEAQHQPLSGGMGGTSVTLPGQATAGDLREARMNFVSADYFDTLNIRLQSGRFFTAEEDRAGTRVVVVSEATARHYWPDANPVGQRIGVGAASQRAPTASIEEERAASAQYPQYTVIGVVRDARSRWIFQKDETFLYLPFPPDLHWIQYLLVRTAGDPTSVMSRIREMGATIDPAVRVTAQRLEDHLVVQMYPFRALSWLSGALGMLALLLAAGGLAGVMSFLVAQRVYEIGVRVALGAQPKDVIALFLKQGLRLTLLGVLLGWLGGAAISRMLAALLVDITPLDPVAFGGTALFLFTVALLACWIPARRALKVDPIVALRAE